MLFRSGLGQGIKSIEEKIADIGSLSRDVKDEEKKSVNKEYTIAKDGVPAVVCSKGRETERKQGEKLRKGPF